LRLRPLAVGKPNKYDSAVSRIRAADSAMASRLKGSVPVGGFEGRAEDKLEKRKMTSMVPVASVHGQKTVLGDSFEICAYASTNSGSKVVALSSEPGWATKMDLFGAATRNLLYVLLSPQHAGDLTPAQLTKVYRKWYCCVGSEQVAGEWGSTCTDTEIQSFANQMGKVFAAGDKQMMARAMACIEDMFDTVEARLADGHALLGGNKVSIDDIMFASHAAFVLFPPEFGAGSCTRWPVVAELPQELQRVVGRFRERAAGKHVMRLYSERRNCGTMPVMVEPESDVAATFALSLMDGRARL